jgi:DNA-binding NarL/FixJ family response regulator
MSGLGQRKAVLVDAHPLWLDAVEEVLARVPVEVVGKTTTFEGASRLIEEFEPELLIVETSERESRHEWLAAVLQRFPSMNAIVLSISDDPADVNAALGAGAAAYVVKKAHPDDLAVAVRQTFESSIYFGKSTSANGITPSPEPQLDHPDLTRRELEILRLVAEGSSNSQLARMLWVTEQTVKFHLSNIYRKLGVSNRTEASRWAQVHGLLPHEQMRSGVS